MYKLMYNVNDANRNTSCHFEGPKMLPSPPTQSPLASNTDPGYVLIIVQPAVRKGNAFIVTLSYNDFIEAYKSSL